VTYGLLQKIICTKLLRGDYTSSPRNVQVADMFKEAGIIERYGSGIGRIVDEFKAFGLSVPEFREIGDGFMVTVFRKRLTAASSAVSRKKAG
jgi:ATP-dependent DNA helicase RecG